MTYISNVKLELMTKPVLSSRAAKQFSFSQSPSHRDITLSPLLLCVFNKFQDAHRQGDCKDLSKKSSSF